MNKYWYIKSFGEISEENIGETAYNKGHLLIGNYFESPVDATKLINYLKIRKQLTKFSAPFNNGTNNFYIEYDCDNDYLIVNKTKSLKLPIIYFKSEEDAYKAINTIGKQNLINNYFI